MVRIARIGAGLALVILGLFLLVLPGPGILTIAGGLAILATEFTWARTLLDWMKNRFRHYFTTKTSSTSEETADDRVG